MAARFLLCLLLSFSLLYTLHAQVAGDSLNSVSAQDSLKKDTLYRISSVNSVASALYDSAKAFNINGNPQQRAEIAKKPSASNYLFFSLVGLSFLLALLRLSDRKHFSTLFRVLFNTSIRQSQLVEQLRQARQTRLLYNILGHAILGFALFLLVFRSGLIPGLDSPLSLLFCVLVIFAVYLLKGLFLNFAGWLTYTKKDVQYYLFNISLVNVTLSILLLPVLFFIAFSATDISVAAMVIACITIAVLAGIRFIRSWSLMQQAYRFNLLQFFLFFISLEVLPIVLITKAATLYFL